MNETSTASLFFLAIALLIVYGWFWLKTSLRRSRGVNSLDDRHTTLTALKEIEAKDLAARAKVVKANTRIRNRDSNVSCLKDIPTAVDFDATNQEHLVAVALLMAQPQRLHPTVRFNFNPALFDNAYSAVLWQMSRYHIPGSVLQRADWLLYPPAKMKKPRRPKVARAPKAGEVKETLVVQPISKAKASRKA